MPITPTGVAGLIGGGGGAGADSAILRASEGVVAEFQALRDNNWPEERFKYEMSGDYLIDPDDDGGPFFWLPSYAPACLPVWLVLSFLWGRRLWRRYERSLVAYRTVV